MSSISRYAPRIPASVATQPPALAVSDKIQAIVSRIEEVQNRFERDQGVFLEGTRGLLYDEEDGYKFFGVQNGQNQDDLDFEFVRKAVLGKLELPEDTQILQVVCDVGEFLDPAAEGVLEQHIRNTLYQHPAPLLLWSFIGNGSGGSGARDVISLVNRLIDENNERQAHALALVAAEDSINVMRKYACNISTRIQNFYLVYGEARPADVHLSADSITDRAICYEGKKGSLLHLIKLLRRDVKITCVHNLRGPLDEFSAVVLFKRIVDYAKQHDKPVDQLTKSEAVSISEQYLRDLIAHLGGIGRATTDPGLLRETLACFIKEELWKKLALCTFEALPRVDKVGDDGCVLL